MSSNFLTTVEAALSVAKSKPSPAAQEVITTGEAFAKAVEAWAPELAVDGINLLIDGAPIIPDLVKPEVKAAIDFAVNAGFQFGGSFLDPLINKALGTSTPATPAVQVTVNNATPAASSPQQ